MQAFTQLAYTYDNGAYGSSTYSYSNQTSSGSTSDTATGGSPLANTGFDILLVGTIACSLIFVALLTKLWRKSSKKSGV